MSSHRVDGGVSPQVGDQERLGREIFSSKQIRRRAGAGAVNYRAFHDTSSPLALSVDRVDVAPFVRLAEIGRGNALRRGPGRRFHGWGVVTPEVPAGKWPQAVGRHRFPPDPGVIL